MKYKLIFIYLHFIEFHNINDLTINNLYIFTVLIPNQLPMKKCLFRLFMLVSFFSFSQEIDSNATASSSQTSSFQIYPNPATQGVVYFTKITNISEKIVIYDVFGEIVLTERISSKSLDISRLVAGVYVLQVTQNGTAISRKLIVN